MSSKELLAEYAKLAAKLEHINETLQEMNAVDIAQLIDKIRVVERKMSLVYTLFKQSVYSITMQNAQNDQDQHQSQEQEQEQQQQQQQQQQQHDGNEEDEQQYQSTTPQQRLNLSQNQDNRRYSQEAQQQQQQQQQYQDHSDYDTSPPQSQQQQQQQQQPLRSSLRTSPNDNSNLTTQPTSILRSSLYRTTTLSSRTSNAREEYQATTGNKSILSLSRGHEGRPRWGNHYGYHSGSAGGIESENHTNRPRYH